MRIAFITVAALLYIGALQARGALTVLYQANFNSPTYTDGPLVFPPTAGDTTTPGQDGWLSSNAGSTNNISVSNAATNGFVSLTTNGQDVRHLFNGGATVDSGTLFYDADVTVSAAQFIQGADYPLHLSNGSTSGNFARLYFKSDGATGYVLALTTSNQNAFTYGPSSLAFGTPYHLLVRYDFVPGANNDTAALYINPTTPEGLLDAPYLVAANTGTALDPTQLAAISLRQGGINSAPTLTVDNYRAFTSDLVPEPSALSLIAAFAVLGTCRRRTT